MFYINKLAYVVPIDFLLTDYQIKGFNKKSLLPVLTRYKTIILQSNKKREFSCEWGRLNRQTYRCNRSRLR